MAWELDASHSSVTFSVRHMMISTVRGQFNVISGKLNIDKDHPENSWVEAEADVASIDTRNDGRDQHLRSPDFFDAPTYPTITFKSTKVESAGGDEYTVAGDLTMHGVTKPVVFKAEYLGEGKDPWGNQKAGLAAQTKINRKDFGLSWNQSLESGGVLVSEDVKIDLDLQVVNKG